MYRQEDKTKKLFIIRNPASLSSSPDLRRVGADGVSLYRVTAGDGASPKR